MSPNQGGRLWHESGTVGRDYAAQNDRIRRLADELEGVGVLAYNRPGAEAHLGSN